MRIRKKVEEKNPLNKHPLQRRGRRTNDTIVSAVGKNYTEISKNNQLLPMKPINYSKVSILIEKQHPYKRMLV